MSAEFKFLNYTGVPVEVTIASPTHGSKTKTVREGDCEGFSFDILSQDGENFVFEARSKSSTPFDVDCPRTSFTYLPSDGTVKVVLYDKHPFQSDDAPNVVINSDPSPGLYASCESSRVIFRDFMTADQISDLSEYVGSTIYRRCMTRGLTLDIINGKTEIPCGTIVTVTWIITLIIFILLIILLVLGIIIIIGKTAMMAKH